MYLYNRYIRHSDSCSFYEGYTLQGIQESLDSGNVNRAEGLGNRLPYFRDTHASRMCIALYAIAKTDLTQSADSVASPEHRPF
jgi:hypothetical protein